MNKKQAIELITLFYVIPAGVYEDELEEFPVAKEFIDKGYAELEEPGSDFYVISDAGDEVLYPHIRDIAEDLVTFVYDQKCESTDEEILKWCSQKYEIEDDETTELLASFMCDKLNHFGWTIDKRYSSEKGWIRVLESLGDDEE
jgi:hypothetical protein